MTVEKAHPDVLLAACAALGLREVRCTREGFPGVMNELNRIATDYRDDRPAVAAHARAEIERLTAWMSTPESMTTTAPANKKKWRK